MSSRVLKKLHGDNELEIREQDASDLDNDNSFIGSSGARKKQFDGNRYDLVIFHNRIYFDRQMVKFLVLLDVPSSRCALYIHATSYAMHGIAYKALSAVIVVVFVIVVQYLSCA